MKTVGIFGWYERQNFGDDLMAVLFSKELSAYGVNSLVWRLSKSTCSEFQIETVESATELFARSDLIVYGGGGLFTRAHGQMEGQGDFASEFEKLISLIKEYKKCFCLLSVGGDGHRPNLTHLQKAALDSANVITLRVDAERDWYDGTGKPIFSYPDIVWKTSLHFEQLASRNPKSTIISHNLSQNELKVFKTIGRVPFINRSGKRIVNFASEYYGDVKGSERICHESVLRTLELLAETSDVFSNRLHLGMAALSLGASLVMIRPVDKVLAAAGESNINCPIVFSKRFLLKEMMSTLFFDGRQSVHIRQQVALNASRANGHIDQLMGFLN